MSETSDRVVTISNLLSLFRALLSLPIIWALETDRMQAVAIMVALAVLSDFLDGYLARRAGEITHVGKLLDPIADKIIMMAVMIYLIFDPVRRFPISFFVLLGIWDITLSTVATFLMDRKAKVFESNVPGKWFIFITTLAIIIYIANLTVLGRGVLLVATGLMLVSWYLYIRTYLSFFRALQRD